MIIAPYNRVKKERKESFKVKIGIPKEIKNHEYRVGLTPHSVEELILQGHKLYIETKAGCGIGFEDDAYKRAGAKILNNAQAVFDVAEMIVKVKEPQPSECKMLHEGQILFTYLHLAPDAAQAEALIQAKVIAIAYETIECKRGRLPLLAPMSEVAGRLSIQAGANALEKSKGGRGILLGGVPGVSPAHILIIGGGIVGTNAAKMAIGLGARVTILDRSIDRLRYLDDLFKGQIETVYSTSTNLKHKLKNADLVIGSVLSPGASAPKLVTRAMLKTMKKHAVIVDVAIDQGGCFETAHPTTHNNPTYIEEDIIHYCVANMPGAVPLTSTFALNHATLPYVIALANKGYKAALLDDSGFLKGLNIYKGKITNKAVSEALGLQFISPDHALKQID